MVDACESDMLPTQWRQMFEVFVGDVVAPTPQLLDCPLNVDGVPQGNRRAQNVQAAGPVHLVFVGAIAHLSEAVEEDSPGKGVTRLSLVEAGGNAAS